MTAASAPEGREPVRVLIADDHPMYRRSVADAITSNARLELVGEAADGAEVLRLLDAHAADLLLLDMRMPELDGFEVLSALEGRADAPRVVFLSAFDDGATVHRALEAGASGFLSKDAGESEICEAIIDVVVHGQTVVSPRLQQAMFSDIRQRGGTQQLSARERQILSGVATGQQLAQIAVELHLSPATVKTYLHRAYDKLGVSTSAAAVAEALKRGSL